MSESDKNESKGQPLLNLFGWSRAKKSAVTLTVKLRCLCFLCITKNQKSSNPVKKQIITIPTQNVPIAISSIPNNLGIVIKAAKLEAFEEFFGKALAIERQSNKQIHPTQ